MAHLNFTKVYRLHKSGRGSEKAGVKATSRRGDDLATASVNSVSV